MLRPALYLIHVALFILFMFLYERIDTNFSQYVFLIGGDENFWIENSSCYWSNSFYFCFPETNNIYPALINVFYNFSEYAIFLYLFKCLLFLASVFFLIERMRQRGKTNLLIFEIFLLINPYILLLHVSAMRDDIILSVLLLATGIFISISKNLRFRDVVLLFLVLFFLFLIRFGIGVTCTFGILFFILLNKFRFFYALILTASFSGIFAYYLYAFFPIEQISYKFALTNLYKLIFSPFIGNVLSGKVRDIGSDVGLVDFYALIYPNFSLLCLAYLGLVIGSGKFKKIKEMFSLNLEFLVLITCTLTPYILSSLDVAGPRQSIFPTVLLFYVFGVPFLRFILKPVFDFERRTC